MASQDGRAASKPRCRAQLMSPTLYHAARCSKRASHEVAGIALCGTHRRLAEKWQSEGRLPAMVKFWWDVTLDV